MLLSKDLISQNGHGQSGPESECDERASEYERGLKKSVRAILVTMFLSSMGFTICIPSLWLYFSHFDECRCHATVKGSAHRSLKLELADHSFTLSSIWPNEIKLHPFKVNDTAPPMNASTGGCLASSGAIDDSGMCTEKRGCNKFSGMIVAAFPLAQLIFSPMLGYWASRRNVKEVINVTLLVMAGGYILYSFAWNRWTLFLSRFLVGSGAGNVSVLRYYTNGATADHKRTGVIAQISGAQSLGFVLGPGIGYFLADMFKGQQLRPIPAAPAFVLNEYTAPGYLSAVLCLLNIALVHASLVELREAKLERRDALWEPPTHDLTGTGQDLDPAAAAAPSPQHDSPLPSPLSRPPGGAGAGGWRVGLCIVLMFSTIVMVFSIYEGVGTQISECALGWGVEENGRFLASMGLCALASMATLKRLSAAVGDWNLLLGAYAALTACQLLLCDWRAPLPLWQWVLGGVLLSMSFPMVQAMLYVILSKEVPRRRQAVLMGYLTSGGSLARMIGPAAATLVYSAAGFRTLPLFIGAAAAMLCPLVVVAACWPPARPPQDPDPRLVPCAGGRAGARRAGGPPAALAAGGAAAAAAGRLCPRDFPEESFGSSARFEVERLLAGDSDPDLA